MPILYLGHDLGVDRVATAAVLDTGLEVCKRFSAPHTPAGFQDLFRRVAELVRRHKVTELAVGMESTGVLAWHLCEAYRSCEQLAGVPLKLYLMNPRIVSAFKATFGEKPKDDYLDAYVIAERVRFGQLTPLPAPDERYVALQKLTRHRYHLVQSLVAEKNRFLDTLFLKFSAYRQDGGLPDAFGAAVGALLTEEMTTDEIAEMPLDDLVSFLQENSNARFADPQKVAASIQCAAANSHRLRKGLADPTNQVLALTMQNIRFFEGQIKAVDKLIAKQLDLFPVAKALLSVTGIGPVLAAGILAEIQDIHRFPSEAQIAKMAGLAWKRRQSGRFEAEETPMVNSGNRYLRYYLVQAANSLRIHNPEYRAYYHTKYREAHEHHHKRACVLTARKLVRLVDTLLRTGRLYQPREQWKDVTSANALPEGLTPAEAGRLIARRRCAKRQETCSLS